MIKNYLNFRYEAPKGMWLDFENQAEIIADLKSKCLLADLEFGVINNMDAFTTDSVNHFAWKPDLGYCRVRGVFQGDLC
jgi:hypothetical protein